MKTTIKMILLLLAITPPALSADNTAIVKQFVDAFNQRDINGMLNLAAPDMRWMSVSGHEVSVETSSHEALRKAMSGYFESVPSSRSEIRQLHQSGTFVYSLEQASWSVGDATKSQCSMAVYELADGKLKHVWYFPSHRCD